MIAIIDSGGANIASVQFALERLGVAAELTADPDKIVNADKVLLPGVGAAPNAMAFGAAPTPGNNTLSAFTILSGSAVNSAATPNRSSANWTEAIFAPPLSIIAII